MEASNMSKKNASMPREAALGVWLNAASLLLGVLKGVLLPVTGPPWIGFLSIGVVAALTVAVARGLNWARITLLVLFLLGLPLVFFVWDLLLREGAASVAILLVQTIAQFAALVLLFRPASNAWFRRRTRGNGTIMESHTSA
jgi:hypothetical protein